MNKDYENLENCLLEEKEPYDRLPTSESLLEESDSLCLHGGQCKERRRASITGKGLLLGSRNNFLAH